MNLPPETKQNERGSLRENCNLEELQDAKRNSFNVLKQILISVIISFFNLSVGVSRSYTGIILPNLLEDIPLEPSQISIYSSLIQFGNLIGCFFCTNILLRFGQRKTCLYSIPMIILGWAIVYLSDAFWVLCISRFVLGLLNTALFNSCPTYIAEIAHPSLRGKLVGISTLALMFGTLFVYLIGSTELGWKAVGMVCGLVPLIPCLFLFSVPDSPRWLSLVGVDDEKVSKSLQYFRSKNYIISEELKDINESVEKVKNTSLREQFRIAKERSIVKRLFLLSYLVAAVNLAGNMVVMAYAVSIFEYASSSISEYTSAIMTGVARVVGVIVHIVTIDHFGRRPTALYPMGISTLCLIILVIYFYLKALNYDVTAFSWVPLACLTIYSFCTSLFRPVLLLLRAELMPNSVRYLAVNMISLFYSLASFIMVLLHPILISSIGYYWTFMIYAANCLAMLVVFYCFVPETRLKSLEEIEIMFK